MLQYLTSAREFLAAINPDLPAALFVVLVFLLVLGIRKAFPTAWQKWAAVVPVLAIDPSPVLVVLSKLWQAVPAAMIGAVLAALQSGADVKTTVYGALLSLLAPVAHELAKNYRGTLGTSRSRPPPVLPMLTFLVAFALGSLISLSGCSALTAAKPVIRTVNDVAKDLCVAHFDEKSKLSFEDLARQFCETRDDLAPWLDAVLAAKQSAAPKAEARHP